jgi:threonine/homoserine/homoserine lactone efflux protein
MAIELIFKGLMIGFSIAMPVGPIGLLCIRNVLTFGMLCGFVTGLGAACADAIYGALAGFGVTTISSFLEAHSNLIQVFGALFLCYLGISTFFAKASNPIG